MTSTSTSATEMTRSPMFGRRDLVGLVLIVAAVVWTFAAATSGGDPWPMAGMFLLVGAAYAVGRVGNRIHPLVVPVLVAALALVLSLLWLAELLPEGADAAPLGYVNARSAFYVEVAVATVMAALFVRPRVGRILVLLLAAGFAAVPLFSRAHAASFIVVLLPAAAAIALEGRRLVVAVWVACALLVAAITATTLLAAAPPDFVGVRVVGDIVGERRVELWSDALDLMAEEPLDGVGPGRFDAESPTAQTDPDLRWAHHGFLQQGAETGIVGMGLLLLLFLWGFWRLAADPSGPAVMGAFALSSLGIMACSDYVLHFPLIPGVTAALVGAAVGFRRDPKRAPSQRSDGRAKAMLDAGLRRSPLQPLFLWRAERKLSVLAYHGIDQPERFEEHLAYMRENAHPVSLAEVLESIRGRRGLPRGAVLITFDDGDRSVFDSALPALRSGGIPGVAFVVAGLLDTEAPFWWEEVEGLVGAGAGLPQMNGQGPASAVRALKKVPDERRLVLIEELRRQRPEVRLRKRHLEATDLAVLERGGIAVANHSLTHPCLGRCSDARVRVEIEEAHGILRSVLGHHPEAFAYPDGDWDRRAAARLEDLGYRAGFLFDHRANVLPVRDPLRISRLRVNAGTSMDRFRTILSGLHPAIHQLRMKAATGEPR